MSTLEPRFEEIDANGVKTGRMVTCLEAKDESLKLQYAQVYLFNSKGEMLVQQRTRHCPFRPNLIDPSAAGHVEPEQSYAECAAQELFEEVGVNAPVEFMFETTHYWGRVQVFRAFHDGPVTIAPAELERADFYPVAKIAGLIEDFPYLCSDEFVTSFQEYLKWSEKHG